MSHAADISRITDYLYVGGQPHPEHAAELAALGVRLVISMRGEVQPPEVFHQAPFQAMWLRTYDTFFTPIPIAKLMEGARVAVAAIARGERVLAHCHYGRHRGVAMGAAILIAHGFSADAAMHLLRQQRRIADPQAWYIRRQIKKFEKQWNATQSNSR